MLKEKVAFIEKHDQALFGKDFREFSKVLKSLPVMINMKELTHVHLVLKKLFSKQKNWNFALAGRMKEFLPAWKLLTKDQELLALVEDY